MPELLPVKKMPLWQLVPPAIVSVSGEAYGYFSSEALFTELGFESPTTVSERSLAEKF